MNTASASPLLQSTTLGDLHLRNRVAMAPMTRARSDSNQMVNPLIVNYYRQRASAGLVITEAADISPQGRGWVDTPAIETDEQAESWREVTDAIHDEGGTVVMQLWHMGRASHSSFRADGSRGVAPSPIAIDLPYIHTPIGKQPHEVPRELETDEIAGIVDDFRVAAERAKRVGFDGIEIHAANGYLLDTFLQSKTNKRTDRYGGSFENRFRFLLQVTEATIDVFGAGRVGVRLGPNTDYNDMGSVDFRESFLYYAQQLDAYGLAYLHMIDGTSFGYHGMEPPLTLAEVRQVYRGPMMGNAGYDRDAAENAIASGDAEAIAFGRPFISNPDLVDRFRNDWPLAEPAPVKHWYGGGSVGFTDYPAYTEQVASTV